MLLLHLLGRGTHGLRIIINRMQLVRGIGLAEFYELGVDSIVGLFSSSFQALGEIVCYELTCREDRTMVLFFN